MATFQDSGIGSIAWYIQTIKANPGRSGFSFIRNEQIDGFNLSYPKLSEAIEHLVSAGYLQRQGKPDAPRSTKYVVTSFGHRYLESHKDDLVPVEKEAVYEKRSNGYYYKDGRMVSRLTIPKHKLDELDGNVNGPVIIKKPAAPVPAHVPAKSVIIPPAPARINKDPEPTPVDENPRIYEDEIKAGVYCIDCGRTVDETCVKEGHLRTTDPEEYFRSKREAESISTPVPKISPVEEQRSNTPSGPENGTPVEISPLENTNIVDQIYIAIGEILLDKFKNKEGMASYTNISVYDLIEHLEKKA